MATLPLCPLREKEKTACSSQCFLQPRTERNSEATHATGKRKRSITEVRYRRIINTLPEAYGDRRNNERSFHDWLRTLHSRCAAQHICVAVCVLFYHGMKGFVMQQEYWSCLNAVRFKTFDSWHSLKALPSNTTHPCAQVARKSEAHNVLQTLLAPRFLRASLLLPP